MCNLCGKKISAHSISERIGLIYEKRGLALFSHKISRSKIRPDFSDYYLVFDKKHKVVEIFFHPNCSRYKYEYIKKELKHIEGLEMKIMKGNPIQSSINVIQNLEEK